MSLLTVGSVAFDKIETPFGKSDKIIGGAATFISLASSYFTTPVNLVAVVGGDFPEEMMEILRKHGIDTSGIEVKKDEKSFFWHGKYHDNMNSRDTVEVQLNVMESFDPQIPESFQDCQFLMLGNDSPTNQNLTLSRLNTRPKFVLLDTMNLWMDIAMDDLKALIPKVDCVTINDEEAKQLSGEYSLRKAAKVIMAMGPKTLIIKKGEHGALLFQGENMFYCPALPLEMVFDPTGAGDSFAGGFIGHLSKTNDLSFENMKRAVIYGSAMASFCVEKFGSERLQNLTQEEISQRVQRFIDLISVDF